MLVCPLREAMTAKERVFLTARFAARCVCFCADWQRLAPAPARHARCADDKIAAGLYVHPRLSEAVGTCTAAFARCMLAGQTRPGVWFPEEQGALADRRALLGAASQGAARFLVNRAPWSLETEPIQLGLGFYL